MTGSVLTHLPLSDLRHLTLFEPCFDCHLPAKATLPFRLTTLGIHLGNGRAGTHFLKELLIASQDTLETLDIDTHILKWTTDPYPQLVSILPIISPTLQHLQLTPFLSIEAIAPLLPTFTSLRTLTLKAPLLFDFDMSTCPDENMRRLSMGCWTKVPKAMAALADHTPPPDTRLRVRDTFGAITSFDTVPASKITIDQPREAADHLELTGESLEIVIREIEAKHREVGLEFHDGERPVGLYYLLKVVAAASSIYTRGCTLLLCLRSGSPH